MRSVIVMILLAGAIGIGSPGWLFGAGEEHIDNRLKSTKLDDRMRVDRLSERQQSDKTVTALQITRLHRARQEPRLRKVRRLMDLIFKKRRVVAATTD